MVTNNVKGKEKDDIAIASLRDPKILNEINKARNKLAIPSTEFSDIFSLKLANSKELELYGGREISLASAAMFVIGSRYLVNSTTSWSSAQNKAEIDKLKIWVNADDSAKELTAKRQKFAKAFNAYNLGNEALLGVYKYPTTIDEKQTRGGDFAFPIYPADLRYLLDGSKKTDEPKSGYAAAQKEINEGLKEPSIRADFQNAASQLLTRYGVTINDKVYKTDYFLDTVLPKLTSDTYQSYLLNLKKNNDQEIIKVSDHFYHIELSTIAFLKASSYSRIVAERQSAIISNLVNTARNNLSKTPTFEGNQQFDSDVFPYILERSILSLTSSTNGTIKSGLSGLQTILDFIKKDRSSITGLKSSAEIRDLFIVLTGDSFLGRSKSILLADSDIDSAANSIFTSKRDQITAAVKKINSSGLLGSIGFLLNITRSVFDTLYLSYNKDKGKLTPQQIISFIGRYISVYAGLGNFIIFLKALNDPLKKAVYTAFKFFRGELSASGIWGPSGLLNSSINQGALHSINSIEMTALDSASELIVKNFSELPFAQEEKFVETFFESELKLVIKDSSQARLLESSLNEISESIVIAAETNITSTAAKVASKVFGNSLMAAGLIADALFFVSAVMAITNEVSDSAILDLTSSALGLTSSAIGIGIAVGALESAAFPPLAIGLAISAVIIGVAAAIINLTKPDPIAKQLADLQNNLIVILNKVQEDGYCHDWIFKIQFLSAFYDLTRKDGKIFRATPPELSIFEDEKDFWNAYKNDKSTPMARVINNKDKLKHAVYKNT